MIEKLFQTKKTEYRILQLKQNAIMFKYEVTELLIIEFVYVYVLGWMWEEYLYKIVIGCLLRWHFQH